MKIVALIIFFISSIAQAKTIKMPELERINFQVDFSDDMDFENMLLAIKRQEDHFNRSNLGVKLKFGDRTISRKDLQKTLLVFKKEVKTTLNCFKTLSKSECYQIFNDNMQRQFDIYRPIPLDWERGHQVRQTLFTAYYSPDFHGSRVKTDVYKNPIYALPSDPNLQNMSSDEINFQGALAGKGLELFYVKESLYDIWLLHVQGGGRVQVENKDGSISKYYLSYAASNGQSFQMLYKYMLDEGMLVKGQAGVPNQRAYFDKHPEDQRRILKSCPSFIFFKVTEDEPLGVQNIPLTENRSIATDYRRVQQYGIINFIKTKRPVLQGGHRQMQEFSRFFINQDTGGAIKGNARVDLYMGFGADAEMSAYSIHQLGEQYYLILK